MDPFQRRILLTQWLPAFAGVLVLLSVIAGYAVHLHKPPSRMTGVPTPATQPIATTQRVSVVPAIDAPAAHAPPTDVLSAVLLDNPAYPTTRPLDIPADLPDAARIVLHHPAYVDPLGNLWLTHPAGRPIAELLAGPVKDCTAVVRERVRYVLWPSDGGAASAIVGDDGHLQVVGPTTTRPLSFPYADFSQIQRVGDTLVVPTGVTTADLMPPGLGDPRQIKLRFDEPAVNSPALVAAGEGVYVWTPWENGGCGSHGVVYIDATGPHPHDNTDGWPDRPIQLIPLGDGGVLVISVGEHGPELKMIPPTSGPPAVELLRTVQPLAQQLANEDPVARDNAQRQIEAIGPSAWPVLESLRTTLPPEAQVRIESILGERLSPTLGGLHPLDGTVVTLARFPGGGGVFRLDGGGTVDADDGSQTSVIPAVIAVRPGRPIEMVDLNAIGGFHVGQQTLQYAGGETVLFDPNAGAQRWAGNKLFPLLPSPGLNRFDTLVGVDARRRWVFAASKHLGETLLLDPSLPDLTPKLPVWIVDAGDAAGWTDAGWPAVKRGDRVLALEEHAWKDTPAARFHSSANFAGATQPTTEPSVTGHPVQAAGHAFVYSDDGMVRRYASGTAAGHVTHLQATFSTGVVGATRVWTDPAGRLILVGRGQLAVTFPDGRVPTDLAALMLRVGE